MDTDRFGPAPLKTDLPVYPMPLALRRCANPLPNRELSLTDRARAGGCAGSNYPFLTSKERDIETGLDYSIHRYYSPAQGRFTSPDEPFAGQGEDPDNASREKVSGY